MESIAIPLSFVVLVWVFGGLMAAALPLAVGGFAILGSMAVLRAVTLVTDVSIFALNLTRGDGSGAGHRLHAADHQPIPRRVGRRRRARAGAGAHDGDGGAHRAVLGDDGRAVDGRDGAVPDVLPEVVRLRRHRRGGIRRRRRDRGGARGDRAARRPAGLTRRAPAGPPDLRPARAGATPGRADILVPLDEIRDAPVDSDRAGDHRAAVGARRAVPRHQVGLPR